MAKNGSKPKSKIPNVNVKHRESLTELEKLALWITRHVGTMGFFLILVLWAAFWLGWNVLAPAELRFDPPAFVLWIFISNIIQLMLMPLIMLGQNLQSRHSEYRAEAEYMLNKESEAEVETILRKLDKQNELMEKILDELQSKKQA